jgi:hypothetical protein
MKAPSVYKKNPDIVTRVFDQETILVPLFKTSKDVDCVYTLSAVASRIWGLLDGKKSCAAIKQILLQEYDVAPEKLDHSLDIFLKDLKSIRAIL